KRRVIPRARVRCALLRSLISMRRAPQPVADGDPVGSIGRRFDPYLVRLARIQCAQVGIQLLRVARALARGVEPRALELRRLRDRLGKDRDMRTRTAEIP